MFQRFIARQLAQPSGLIGRRFTARWLNKANARMNQLALEQLHVAPGDRILEVGFGGGDLLERILRTNQAESVAGIDLSHDMLRVVSEKLRSHIRDRRLELKCGDIEELPFGEGEFTKLCSVNTIYFWRDPVNALAECRRVLKPQGRLILCFNSKEDMQAWPIHQHGFQLYELAEVESLLRGAGFSSIEVTSAHDPRQGLFYCVSGIAV